ncbi:MULTISPECIES: helix-turn-helix domain-containing protein [unclassified Rhodococcus (in: high G+C Gram-positive bacteria)]|uniref:helix-turn-helix domain-containing protein n=1 Tax=unclassified Rhodococcus (in: high G+C Gram-positive bacteria) TaxID=192944 RepID=UPI00163A8A5A|nr:MULTISPECIES: helix-turn-helix transcriptional regulator [unclassified Rhodococcus (in: high G+C Gram-positive bacteria)]MBC2640854.1 helix-turn-helix domain-containing protein [Rhodococcus sp. 3A]MBC2894402.1 helix-turn-helix domain-containing protein [Rhodococcus sp. 4CII]
MDIAKDLKEFLMTRRAKITPEQVGLPPGRRRRVPGLRREEVAQLAGVSIEYYTQIERGNVAGVSDDVLHSVARALRLTEEETAHLFDLVRAAGSARSPRRVDRTIPDGVQALIDGMVDSPAVVLNGHLDIVAANPLGRTLYAPVFARATGVPNLVRFIFFDPHADDVFPEWNTAADDAVALLRVEAAHSPHSTVVTGLVGELATRSEEFRTRWAAHDVKAHRHGVKQFRHPDVGDLSLTFNVFDITGAAGLSLVGYTAEPQSPSEQALRLLAVVTATDRAPAGPATDTPSTTTE